MEKPGFYQARVSNTPRNARPTHRVTPGVSFVRPLRAWPTCRLVDHCATRPLTASANATYDAGLRAVKLAIHR